MQLQAFTFGPSLALRVVDIDGEPWFVAKDVCAALDLDTSRVRRTLDPEEVAAANVSLGQVGRGGRAPLIISESGLYRLMMRSDKAEARPFQRFVTREVLPAIRKRGAFMTQDTAQRVINDAQEGVRIAHEQLAESRRLHGELKRRPPRHSEHHTKPRTVGASSFLDPTCLHAFSRRGSMSVHPLH